jgi:hypothetical protein
MTEANGVFRWLHRLLALAALGVLLLIAWMPAPLRVLGRQLDAGRGQLGLLLELDGKLVHRLYDLADFRLLVERVLTGLSPA